MKWLRKKHLLKKAVKGLLPGEVITHRKQGFVGPMAQWLKNDLKHVVLDMLSHENLEKHGLFNAKTVRTVLDEHFSRREIHDTLMGPWSYSRRGSITMWKKGRLADMRGTALLSYSFQVIRMWFTP